ncbi:MAG: biopolymer transporter ExbD [Planctomycetes bacterium]|nr:biopolymer transporter ExbD [Planctomycetota bacterium]
MKQVLKFDAAAEHEPVLLAVAPMVDIVMLLICFFMLASQLVITQKDPAVLLPGMKSPLGRPEAPAEVTVNLRPDGAVTVDNRRVPPEALPGLLAAEKERAGRENRPLRVVVRADRRQRFAALDNLLSACRRAGLGQVIFRAQQEDAP